jgi:hypothetical protein
LYESGIRQLFGRNAVVLENLVSFGFATVLAYALDEATPVEVVADVVDVGQANGTFAIGALFNAVVHKGLLGKEFQEGVSG